MKAWSMKKILIVMGLLSFVVLGMLYKMSERASAPSREQSPPVQEGVGRQMDSQKMLEASVTKNPGDYTSRHDLAILYAARGETDRAIHEFEEVLKLNPRSWEGHYNLGILYYDVGYIEQAIHHYKQAVDLKPNEADIHFNLGLAYVRARDFKQAVAEYQETLRLDAKNVAAHNNLGNLYRHLNHPDLAVQEYALAIQLNPEDILANYNLAITKDLMGMHREVVPYYEAVVSLAGRDPNNPEWHHYAKQAQERLAQLKRP
jgi:tetratricopeptide (TPR) repeat protein